MRAICCAILALVTWKIRCGADSAGNVITSGLFALLSLVLLVISVLLCIAGL